jgi:glycosyltransferase 2 family protein
MRDATNLPPRSASLTRSPIHLLTLLLGVALALVGWGLGTLIEAGIVTTTHDVLDLIQLLPEWMEGVPDAAVDLGSLGAAIGVTVWLLWAGRPRELALVYVAIALAAVASTLAGEALMWVSRPEIRQLFEELPRDFARRGPTDQAVAALTAVLALTRRWIPSQSRRVVMPIYLAWLAASAITVSAPPYLGLVLDVGIGMIVGSVVALAFGVPSLQPGREELIAGMARSGIQLASLEPAQVDARGSTPWEGTTTDGAPIFVKAFSVEQRAADLLFRALRWLTLRRSGDRPPEMSLKRAAEHEALVVHHVRTFDLPAPKLLAVADLGDNNVALAYEALSGLSLDQVDPETITDEMLKEMWGHVLLLREHGIAHRDLRLANIFLRDEGGIAVVDFGFAELAADPELLDADVAELLAATSAIVGVERGVAQAHAVLGTPSLERARDWLQPLALTTATRSQVTEDTTLEDLRTEVELVTGHAAAPNEPVGRLSAQRVVALLLLTAGVYSVLAVMLDKEWPAKIGDLRVDLAASALVLSALAYPLAGASARALSGRRLSPRTATAAALASTLPGAAPATWAWAGSELFDAARRVGIWTTRARSLVSAWILIGLATAPLVVAVFGAAGWREEHGLAAGSVYGVAVGLGLAIAQVALIFATPWGRELRRVWIAQEPRAAGRGASILTSAALWVAARSAQGGAAALAMRAIGVEAPFELLVAIAVAAATLASLTPAPGGIGASEAILYGLLVAIGEQQLAGAAMVVARTVGFWVHLPFAWAAHRSLLARRAPQATRPREAVLR